MKDGGRHLRVRRVLRHLEGSASPEKGYDAGTKQLANIRAVLPPCLNIA